MQEPFIVLLTATIDLQRFSQHSKRSEPETRLRDYQEALRFWEELDDPRIAGVVVCENSGSRDIESLAEIARGARKDIETLSYLGEPIPPGLHYGYRELGAIDYACEQSRLIRSCRTFLKATGRLRFPNVKHLLDALPDGLDCALDMRRAYPREGGSAYRARTQLLLFSRDFYRRHLFAQRDRMIGRCSHIEEWLTTVLLPLYKTGDTDIALRFPIECEIAGVQGSDNLNYEGLRPRWKRSLRGALRRAAPGWWL